jgi:hypothetical protein
MLFYNSSCDTCRSNLRLFAPAHDRLLGADRRRSGFTRERAGPAGQFPWSFAVAATTAFAGEPAPTRGWTQTVVGAGLPAKGPDLLPNLPGHSPSRPPPYSRVNPLLPRGWTQTVVGAGLPAKGPGLLANFPDHSPSQPPPHSRVNPLLHMEWRQPGASGKTDYPLRARATHCGLERQ